jgi:hypothetical protein
MPKTAAQLDAEYEKDDLYYRGVPTLSDEQLEEIYKSAGINIKTGLATGKTINGDLIITVSPKVTLHAMKEAAAQCGCISCTGALEGIRAAVRWYAQARAAHKYARKNRQYFIKSLRDVLTSSTIDHKGE